MDFFTKHTTANNPVLKIAAMVIFILFPIFGFLFGMQYQKIADSVQMNLPINSNSILPPAGNSNHNTETANDIMMKALHGFADVSSIKKSLSSDFTCYKKEQIPNKDTYIMIQNEFNKSQRSLVLLCTSKSSNNILLQSVRKDDTSKHPKFQISIYTTSLDPQTKEVRLLGTQTTQEVKDAIGFLVNSWSLDDSIVYTVVSDMETRTYVYDPRYMLNNWNETALPLVEYCRLSYKQQNLSFQQCWSVNNTFDSQFPSISQIKLLWLKQ